jgi:tyrosine-protein phosphatase YwqE
MDDALELLGMMEAAGVKTVWCTPHIMEDIPNKTDFLKMHFEKLKSLYKGNIELHLAAEYMIDSLFQERLENDDLLVHANNHVLVESSTVSAPYGFKNTLKELMHKGHYVLLAHPERYRFLEKKDYVELKEMKIRFQLNLTSLLGLYGPAVREKAEMLLAEGFYEAVGTDTHRVKRWQQMEEQKISKKIIKQVSEIQGL